jgi:serine/threonine protein kinase
MTTPSAPATSRQSNAIDRLARTIEDSVNGGRLRTDASSKGTVLHRRDRNDKGGLLERAYNRIHGRAEIRRTIKAALAEAEALAPGNSVIRGQAQMIRDKFRAGHDLKLSEISTQVLKIREELGASAPAIPAREVSLAELADRRTHKALLAPMAGQLRAGQSTKRMADDLEGVFTQLFAHANAATCDRLLMSRGSRLEEEVLQALKDNGLVLIDASKVRKAVSQGFLNALLNLTGARANAMDKIPGSRCGMPTQILGDAALCVPVKQFQTNETESEVRLYRSKNGEEFVIKAIPPGHGGDAERFEKLALEIEACRRAMKGGENILAAEAIRLADGSLAMKMKCAPGGSLHDLIGKLTGPSSGADVYAALSEDCVKGLQALNSPAGQVSHFDSKPANLLITAEGKAVVSDFGRSVIGRHVTIPASSIREQNPLYTDPLLYAQVEALDLQWTKDMAPFDAALQVHTDAANRSRAHSDAYKKAMAQREALKKQQRPQTEQIKAKYQHAPIPVDGLAANCWGYGITLFELHGGGIGSNPFNASMPSGAPDSKAMRAKLTAYAEMSPADQRKFLFDKDPGKNIPGEIQDLIAGLMSMDPNVRMTTAENALKNPDGSPKRLGGLDDAREHAARDAIKQAFGTSLVPLPPSGV